MMTGPDRPLPVALPPGYRHEIERTGLVRHVRIMAKNGDRAAGGYAVEAGGVFVYDRIITQASHQRRGLGAAVMALLGADQYASESHQVLVATAAGRALYERLGWTVHAPYASAVRCRP